MLFSESSGGSQTATGPELDPALEASKNPLVGRLLCGKWRVERLLGTGGMSSVYSATHRNGRRVAIKVLSPELRENPRARERFLREGYIANRVAHPGAVSVLDDDVTPDGIVFLVMELLEGETLSARCERLGGRLELADALTLGGSLLDVLVAAHQNGIIHRDVKPSNLFLTRQAGLKLLDFGIASLRELPRSLSSTGSGAQLGTPGFMAPEQARGHWAEVSARTDIWATGATLFRLLSGRMVHDASSANEAMIRAATVPAPSLTSVTEGIPTSVAALVDKALAFDAKERFQSAAEMRDAIRSAGIELPEWPASTRSSLPVPVSFAAEARLTRRAGFPLRTTLAAVGAAAILVGVLVWHERPRPQPAIAAHPAAEARAPREPAPQTPPRAVETAQAATHAPTVFGEKAHAASEHVKPPALAKSKAAPAIQQAPPPKPLLAIDLTPPKAAANEPGPVTAPNPTSTLPYDPRDRR